MDQFGLLVILIAAFVGISLFLTCALARGCL